MKKILWGFVLGAMLLASASVQAQLVAGKNYQVLVPAQPTESGDKIEVIEFFWYGCPHCYDFEPYIDVWRKKLPADVVFRRVPAQFRDSWAPVAKAYYTFEALGETERLHKPFFDAIHKEKLPLEKDEQIAAWAVKQGIPAAKWEQAYKSFSVVSKAARAKQLAIAYKIDGVPTVAVQGKYVTSNVINNVEHRQMPAILDQVVAMARAEKGKK